MSKQKPRINRPRHQRHLKQSKAEHLLRPRSEIIQQRKQRRRFSEGPSLEALAGIALAFPFGYLAVEGIMNDNRHPLHWVIAGVVGVLGYAIGQGIYRWRESH